MRQEFLILILAISLQRMPNHIQHAVTVIGMLVPATEYRIDNEAPPVHLQGLESLFLFVGRFDALSAQRIVVIHHHRIYIFTKNVFNKCNKK